MADELQGEFCYVQTSDGKIVSVHYGTTANEDAVNIKRSIATTFQANFDGDKNDVEEADASSVHTSHYTYEMYCTLWALLFSTNSLNKESVDLKFTREVRTDDLIKMANA